LCDFIRVYYERLSVPSYECQNGGSIASNGYNLLSQFKLPSLELLRICIEQMQMCEVDKFRNLNKLAILINLIGSLLRVNDLNGLFSATSDSNNASINSRICIQLTKSLVQVKKKSYIF
jgi:hypothetical protein